MDLKQNKRTTKTDTLSGSILVIHGGDKRIRTAGLLVANEALYQLSHIPLSKLIIYLFYFFVNKFQIST